MRDIERFYISDKVGCRRGKGADRMESGLKILE